MSSTPFGLSGLNTQQVASSRAQHGSNLLDYQKTNVYLEAIVSLFKEPMVLLLIAAATIYFILGETGDGIYLLSAVALVGAIALYQDSRSRDALEKLKEYTQPQCKVIRESQVLSVNSTEVVVGDYLLLEEGILVAADGTIVHSHDFSVNESILTGESLAVFKDENKTQTEQQVFQGSTVASGLAVVQVSAIGQQTRLGKIGKSLESIEEEPTPLEKQINGFVKKMVAVGALFFLVVWGLNYLRSQQVLDSLLKALTLAMSILPEEIPVAFTTFMAIGAWRMMKQGIIVKQMKTVETLGSATVICTDKTGTLTENRMSLASIFSIEEPGVVTISDNLTPAQLDLVSIAMWASEPAPFDPMEAVLHQTYQRHAPHDDRVGSQFIHEYPLGGQPPMMTHIFKLTDGRQIVAAKGAQEAILQVCHLSPESLAVTHSALTTMTANGYRVLGVAEGHLENKNFPASQQDIPFAFKGLVAFYDPPKKNIQRVLRDFYQAGIDVKIITGDNPATTTSIAKQIGFEGFEYNLTGEQLMKLSDNELSKQVIQTKLFTRMFPEAKLRIINALKAQQQIVAMTGDGVNDGPALKAAHIGIAMGQKGTEIAKQAASLILVKDDLSKMVTAVAAGRKIYTNLKKAIRYIISIHVPIILTVFIPLALGWIYPNIFSPVHVIFLELIMGPTCSIIYENEPMEKNTMKQMPRPMTATFFNWKEMSVSVLQGLAITLGTMATYQYAVGQHWGEEVTRAMVFLTLIVANVFLTLVNRSFYYSIFTTIGYRNNLVPIIIGITLSITALLLYMPVLANFFDFQPLTLSQVLVSSVIGMASVLWFEFVKAWKRFQVR